MAMNGGGGIFSPGILGNGQQAQNLDLNINLRVIQVNLCIQRC